MMVISSKKMPIFLKNHNNENDNRTHFDRKNGKTEVTTEEIRYLYRTQNENKGIEGAEGAVDIPTDILFGKEVSTHA